MVCLVPLKGRESVRPLAGASSVAHVPVLPPSSGRSRQFHRKWPCRHPFVMTCQLCDFASVKDEDRDPQPSARRCFASAAVAGNFSIFQFRSRLGCHVVRCPTQELRRTGRTVAVTKMSFIPSVVDKFLYSPVLTLLRHPSVQRHCGYGARCRFGLRLV